MATKNRIGLRIPDQSPPRGRVFFLSDREVEEWVERLPVANIGETSRQLFLALRDFNRTRISYKKRLMIAERLREPVGYVAANLSKHFVDVGFPLTVKAHKIAILNRELHSGLATTFKCAVVDILLEQHGRPDRKLLTIAIHRAINYLSRVILLSVLAYDSYPKRTWRELHVLHRLACRYNIESTSVKDPLEAHGRSSTIDEAYRRCVLFSLASPYKMRQRENNTVFDALLEWSRYTRFYSFSEAPAESTIILRQDTDQAPSHESLNSDADSRYLLRMDASELLDKLREQFDEQTSVDTLWGTESLDKNLLRQLMQLWSAAQKRSFVRTKLNFELLIAVGLSNIYQLIQATKHEEQEPAAESREAGNSWLESSFGEGKRLEISPHFTLQPLELYQHDEARRGDFEEFGPNSHDTTEPEPVTSIWDKQEKKGKSETTYLFHTLNESAGGYCLDWKGSQPPRVLVGELVGIQSAMASGQFGVGLVRWMKSNPNESMQVGLQMIAPNAIAVTARHDNQSDSRTHECLLLPEVGTSGQPTSFVCPAFPFKVGDLLTISDGQKNHEVKLTRLLESSGTISQFQFIYLDQSELSDDEEIDYEQGDDSDFESLWSSL